MRKTTISIIKTYGEAGVELASRTIEPPDHLGIELAYLFHFGSKEANARRSNAAGATAKYLRMQYDFLGHHAHR
jgi:TorA maturation chaperone TorD